MHTSIKIEAPLTKKEIVQCINGQRYGHTKKYCHRTSRCVKCAGEHRTIDSARKEKDTSVKCVLCGKNHPANYEGCDVYQQIRRRKYPSNSIKSTSPTDRLTGVSTSQIRPGISYAEVAKIQDGNKKKTDNSQAEQSSTSSTQQQEHNSNNTTNQRSNEQTVITKLETMMTKLMERMDAMLNIITVLVTNMNNAQNP